MNRLLAGALVAASLLNIAASRRSDAEIMARCMWGECRGMETVEQAAVAWCVLNRVDSDQFPDTIHGVISQPNQFTGYHKTNPVDPGLLLIAEDVISRWEREHDGETDVGRVLPSEYLYFCGHGGHNHFGTTWPVSREWDWSYENPYEQEDNNEPIDGSGGMDEHDEPASETDRAYAHFRRCYGRFDDGLVD